MLGNLGLRLECEQRIPMETLNKTAFPYKLPFLHVKKVRLVENFNPIFLTIGKVFLLPCQSENNVHLYFVSSCMKLNTSKDVRN
jgi:hypothetical protein